MAGGGYAATIFGLMARRIAFTMAEILLSLTIIGVVAAITLPSLTGNINERTWNTQRKALYSRMSQAVALMPSMNQYSDGENFLANGLSKVLKINNICDNEHLGDCGLPDKIINTKASKIDLPKDIKTLNAKNVSFSYSTDAFVGSYSFENVNAVAFETANGESVLAFYNRACRPLEYMQTEARNGNKWYYATEKVCANFVYDLNGKKGPNTIGKDMGVISILYPFDSVVVAPMPYLRNEGKQSTFADANKICKSLGDEYRVPNSAELVSLFYNDVFFNIPTASWYWGSERYDAYHVWSLSATTGRILPNVINSSQSYDYVRCVQR